jgi:hypothetical protein
VLHKTFLQWTQQRIGCPISSSSSFSPMLVLHKNTSTVNSAEEMISNIQFIVIQPIAQCWCYIKTILQWTQQRIWCPISSSSSFSPLLVLHLSSPPVFREVRVARSWVFCVVFCRWLFVLLSFLLWPLCCLFFFDLRILITSLVSSNSSYIKTLLQWTPQRIGCLTNTFWN